MKKGQRRTYDKEAFQTGLTQNGISAAMERISIWGGSGQDKKDRLNLCRKKKKRK